MTFDELGHLRQVGCIQGLQVPGRKGPVDLSSPTCYLLPTTCHHVHR